MLKDTKLVCEANVPNLLQKFKDPQIPNCTVELGTSLVGRVF